MTGSSYALRQTEVGDTLINAASGRTGYMRVANSDILTWTSAGMTMAGSKSFTSAMPILTTEVKAMDAGGLLLTDDGGNFGVNIADGGGVGIGGTSASGFALAVTGRGVSDVSSPSSSLWEFRANGAAIVRIGGNPGDTNYNSYGMAFPPMDRGTEGGKGIFLDRNNNASTPAAAWVGMRDKGNTGYYIWPDDSGVLRIHTAQPSNANDTAGTVVGAQTSAEEFKRILGPGYDGWQALTALQVLVDSDPFRRFIYQSGAYNGQEFDGLVLSAGSPATYRYGMDRSEEFPHGRALNEVVAIADLIRALVHVAARVERMEQKWR
jgi:hypothetical protein